MYEFIRTFLAEFIISIGTANFSAIFFYKNARGWKILSVAVLSISILYYLSQKFLNIVLFIIIFLAILFVGSYILYKNMKIGAYNIILNPKKVVKKKSEKTKGSVSKAIKNIEKMNVGLFGAFGLIIFVTIPEALEHIQPLLQLFGVLFLVGIIIFYYSSNKKTLEKNLRINLLTFFSTSYALMSYAFFELFFHLSYSFSIEVFTSLIGSTILIMFFYFFMEQVLRYLKSTIISDRNITLAKIYSKYFKINVIITLILILLLSDGTLVYTILLYEDIGSLILWSYGFVSFLSATYRNSIIQDIELKIGVGIISKSKIRKELKKIEKINYFNF